MGSPPLRDARLDARLFVARKSQQPDEPADDGADRAAAEDSERTGRAVEDAAEQVGQDRADAETGGLQEGLARCLQPGRQHAGDGQDVGDEDAGEEDPRHEARRQDRDRILQHDPAEHACREPEGRHGKDGPGTDPGDQPAGEYQPGNLGRRTDAVYHADLDRPAAEVRDSKGDVRAGRHDTDEHERYRHKDRDQPRPDAERLADRAEPAAFRGGDRVPVARGTDAAMALAVAAERNELSAGHRRGHRADEDHRRGEVPDDAVDEPASDGSTRRADAGEQPEAGVLTRRVFQCRDRHRVGQRHRRSAAGAYHELAEDDRQDGQRRAQTEGKDRRRNAGHLERPAGPADDVADVAPCRQSECVRQRAEARRDPDERRAETLRLEQDGNEAVQCPDGEPVGEIESS
jgi:hypothetical protein